MSRLRRHLPTGMVESVGGGYRLDPAAIDLDGDRLSEALTTPGLWERLRANIPRPASVIEIAQRHADTYLELLEAAQAPAASVRAAG